MIRDPRFRTPDDELAIRLGRYWDALVEEDAAPPGPAADLGDLAVIVRGLADLPRETAPEAIHARARARLGAHPDVLTFLTTESHDAATFPMVSNGHAHIDDAEDESPNERPPTPFRRLLPFVELAGIAAVIAVLLFVAFDHYQTADKPTPTVSPTQIVTPTTAPVTPTAAPDAVGDWPMLGGGPTRTGGADRTIPATAPTLKWAATLPPGVRSPIAAGDAVYASNGGVIVALDAATGTERWRFDLGVAPSVAGANPPAVVGGTVYAAAHDGTVFALDAATGHLLWSHETGGTVTTSVAVAAGTVFVGTVEGDLDALDAATGDLRWSSPTGPISVSSPVVADGVVYVGGGGDTLFAIDAASGSVRWREEVKAGMQSVAVGDGIAVAAGTNTGASFLLVAVDAASGVVRWQGNNGADLPPAIVGGMVYVINGSHVEVSEGKRGTKQWVVDARVKVVDFAVVGKALLLCRNDGTAIALDAATGKERWRIATGGKPTGIAVGVGVMYVAHGDGTLAAYG
jgi:outer membrane protein assembly factor BamB